MQLVLEIKSQQDLAILLPLLERLKIPVISLPGISKAKKPSNGKTEVAAQAAPARNFDLEKLENLFDQLQAMNAFSEISNPADWQKQLRDEWN